MRILLLCLLGVLCGCTTGSYKAGWAKNNRIYLKRLYNWVLADNEAAKYKDQEDLARKQLQTLREITNVYLIVLIVEYLLIGT